MRKISQRLRVMPRKAVNRVTVAQHFERFTQQHQRLAFGVVDPALGRAAHIDHEHHRQIAFGFVAPGEEAVGEFHAGFHVGANYQTRFVKAGFALNRMSTSWIKKETSNLSNYFSGYAQGMIPIRGGDDMLEPYVAFRKFSESNDTYDLGLYYTYNNKIIAGAAMRKGNVVNGSLGFKFSKYLLVGYAREMIMGSVGGFVGAANEITLRLDFNDETYKERFRADTGGGQGVPSNAEGSRAPHATAAIVDINDRR